MITLTGAAIISNPDVTEREVIVDGTAVLSGNYGGGATHGDTLDLTQFLDLLKSSQQPTKVEVYEAPPAGTLPSFYQFVYCPGTTQKNGVVSIGSNLTEYTEGTAYSAPLLAAVVKVRAWFPAV